MFLCKSFQSSLLFHFTHRWVRESAFRRENKDSKDFFRLVDSKMKKEREQILTHEITMRCMYQRPTDVRIRVCAILELHSSSPRGRSGFGGFGVMSAVPPPFWRKSVTGQPCCFGQHYFQIIWKNCKCELLPFTLFLSKSCCFCDDSSILPRNRLPTAILCCIGWQILTLHAKLPWAQVRMRWVLIEASSICIVLLTHL